MRTLLAGGDDDDDDNVFQGFAPEEVDPELAKARAKAAAPRASARKGSASAAADDDDDDDDEVSGELYMSALRSLGSDFGPPQPRRLTSAVRACHGWAGGRHRRE